MGLPIGVPGEVGGGPTRDEAVHLALRLSVGTLAGPEDGLEDAWRRIKAKALVDTAVSVELACMQALPALSTAHIPVYERLLKISVAASDTEEDRRQRITEIWTRQSRVDFTSLNKALKAISSKLSASPTPNHLVTSTRFGRYLAPVGDPSLKQPEKPNYSTAMIVRVQYTLGVGESLIPDEIRKEAEDLLNASLPSWVDYLLHTGEGFFCNGVQNSYLNFKALGS